MGAVVLKTNKRLYTMIFYPGSVFLLKRSAVGFKNAC